MSSIYVHVFVQCLLSSLGLGLGLGLDIDIIQLIY